MYKFLDKTMTEKLRGESYIPKCFEFQCRNGINFLVLIISDEPEQYPDGEKILVCGKCFLEIDKSQIIEFKELLTDN